jgi:hypothetical protein
MLEDEPDPNRWSGVLTNGLGIGDVTRVATFVVPLYAGDRLVLMSDGISEYVPEGELDEAAGDQRSPARAAQRLVDLALERGGADNATAVVVKVVEPGVTRVPAAQRERDAAAVASCPLFEDLSGQERLRALRITTEREVRPGRDVPAAALGDRVAHLILDGEAEAADGKRLGPGTFLYPTSLIAGSARVGEAVRAVGDMRLLTIRRDDFLELSEEEPDLGVKLYAALATLLVR